MEIISNLFDMAPFVALFITLSLGYMVGKITIGRFVLGGVAGTLLMGVIIGQFGVHIDPGVKSIFFALSNQNRLSTTSSFQISICPTWTAWNLSNKSEARLFTNLSRF